MAGTSGYSNQARGMMNKTCPDCNGSGTVWLGLKTCGTCDGSGLVDIEVEQVREHGDGAGYDYRETYTPAANAGSTPVKRRRWYSY